MHSPSATDAKAVNNALDSRPVELISSGASPHRLGGHRGKRPIYCLHFFDAAQARSTATPFRSMSSDIVDGAVDRLWNVDDGLQLQAELRRRNVGELTDDGGDVRAGLRRGLG